MTSGRSRLRPRRSCLRSLISLPKDHHLTFLEVQRRHKKVHHCGVKSTLAELRTKFWVPKGRQVVKKILSQCVTCTKWESTAFTQPATASLPDFRVNLAPPFSRVGVDFAGQMYVKERGKQLKKVYVCLFSCILGDPGAVSGGREKVETGENFSAPEFFSRPFRLFPAPTNCPWVSEDEKRSDCTTVTAGPRSTLTYDWQSEIFTEIRRKDQSNVFVPASPTEIRTFYF